MLTNVPSGYLTAEARGRARAARALARRARPAGAPFRSPLARLVGIGYPVDSENR